MVKRRGTRVQKKEAVRKKAVSHGKCQICGAEWDPTTDMEGWGLDRRNGKWVTCPSCTIHKAAIADAKNVDPRRYWAWFICDCKAFDIHLERVKPHDPGCRAVR